jgi:predicted transcriptional regulator
LHQEEDDKMNDLSSDISNTIFKRTINTLKGSVSLNIKMLELLMMLDGQTNIRQASEKMHISQADMRPLLSRLIECGLVVAIQENSETLDPRFFGYLVGQLSRVTGPIAQVMSEDAILEINSDLANFPKSRAPELIDLLGRRIPNETKKIEFVQKMLQKLREVQ